MKYASQIDRAHAKEAFWELEDGKVIKYHDLEVESKIEGLLAVHELAGEFPDLVWCLLKFPGWKPGDPVRWVVTTDYDEDFLVVAYKSEWIEK